MKICVIVTAISGAGFSLGGVLLALVLRADVMACMKDPFAFLVMFIALAIVFFMTKWYLKRGNDKRFMLVYYFVCYFAAAGLPTLYNYLTDSILKSPLSLVFSGLPVIAVGVYLYFVKKKSL